MCKKIGAIVLTLIILSSVVMTASAATLADEYFDSAGITLTTTEAGSFSATTRFIVGFIRVDSCWLQKWDGSSWNYYCWLPAPSNVEYNTIGYDAYIDYSAYVPNDGGTYRIGAYYNADNHTIRRFSNSRTFN